MSPPYNLTEEEEKDAQSSLNRYYTWIALGKPNRKITDEEARHHYASNTTRYRVRIFTVYHGDHAQATLG
jgi:hypothetical protein